MSRDESSPMAWQRCLAWLVLAFCCGWPVGNVLAQNEVPRGAVVEGRDTDRARLFLVLSGDTGDPKIGDSVLVDLDRIRDLFSYHVPRDRLRIREVAGRDLSRTALLTALGDAQVRPDKDTLVLYFSGHGGFDAVNRDHILKASRDETYRSDLRKAIERRRPRLTVILTDTCSSLVARPPKVGAAPRREERLSRAFESLFFEPRGIVDLSCTRPGEEALCDRNGGYFTNVFCNYINRYADDALAWGRLINAIDNNVARQYSDAKQTIYTFAQLPQAGGNQAGGNSDNNGNGTVAPRRPRLGASVMRTRRSEQRGGVEVVQVLPGTPATAMRSVETGEIRQLVPGINVITHINGQPIHSYDDFSRAIDNSPSRMKARVYNLQTGTLKDYETTLRD